MSVISKPLQLVRSLFPKPRMTALRTEIALPHLFFLMRRPPPRKKKFQCSRRICRSRSSPLRLIISSHRGEYVFFSIQTDLGTQAPVRNKTVPILKESDICVPPLPCGSSVSLAIDLFLHGCSQVVMTNIEQQSQFRDALLGGQ